MAEQITIESIREKFPMYKDVSDDDLVIAIRKKFYPDIPIQQFVKRIKYEGADPTDGMSGPEKALAGWGKAVADLGRGFGQFAGLTSRADVQDARTRDEPLMRSTEAKMGNIAGNVANMIPTAFIPGAGSIAGATAIGAATGLAQPSTSTGETLQNIGLGSLSGPAGIAAGRLLGAGAGMVGGLVAPFTRGGQEKIAADTLKQFADDPVRAAAALRQARELVPGSAPTMAQASGDSGLAQLERTLANNPETGPALAGQYSAQRSARLGAVQNVAGTDDYYKAIKEGRQLFAKEDYGRAMAEGIDAKMAEALQPQIQSLMARPSIQQARAEAIKLAKEADRTIDDFGSIEGLDWLKKGLDNLIDKAKQPGSSVGKEKLRLMTQTKQDLMSVIEDVAPAYKEANHNFADMSKQVNAMDAARDLLGRMQSPLARFGANERELKNEYARALEQSLSSVKRSTGMDRPLSAVMPDRDVSSLQNVAQDMARAANAQDMGRAVGSNTAQNLASQNLLRRTLGPTGLPESWAESTGLQSLLAPYSGAVRMAGGDRAVMNRLSQAALDPNDAAGLLLLSARQPRIQGLLGMAEPYLPGVSLGLLGYGGQ